MLTKDDLSQMQKLMLSVVQTETRKIVQEETRSIVKEEINPLRKKMISLTSSIRSELRSQVRKVRKDINIMIRVFDNQYMDLRVGVEKIEDHLRLPHN